MSTAVVLVFFSRMDLRIKKIGSAWYSLSKNGRSSKQRSGTIFK